ncbi:MAG: DNA polymerase III subunit delta [Acholeplasmatales bacterium]|nr:DNA polymerase III subunit delta [Acholeplasmatales bacterium]
MVSYFLSTDDYSAASNKIEEIRRSLSKSFEEISYDLDEDSIYEVINDLTTISLFEEPKLITIKSAELITEISDNALNELLSAMGNYDSENILIGITVKDYDFKNKGDILNRIKKNASFIDIQVKNIPVDEYIEKSFKSEGYSITPDVVNTLKQYTESLTQINSSIEILKCYKADTKSITSEDINLMIPKPLEDKGYELTNALLAGEKKRVFEIYEDFKIMNAAGNVIPMLLNKFQQLYNAYILNKAQTPQEVIATLLNVSKGQAYYIIKGAKSRSVVDIKRNIEYLNKLDYDIKTGKIDYELGLQLYFLR